MNLSPNSKSLLFLIELLITILFFSLTSAICIQLFVRSHRISTTSLELDQGVMLCENMAELYQHEQGFLNNLFEYYPKGELEDDTFFLYLDPDFEPCDLDTAQYRLSVLCKATESDLTGKIVFCRLPEHHEIYSLNVLYHCKLTGDLSFERSIP